MATRPYRRSFITNIGSIATSGSTYNLGDFEIGVFDAKTNAAVTAPSYPTNSAIYIAWGRDARTFPTGVGMTNVTPRSYPIKAPNIVSWEGRASQRPQNMIVTLGFDGVDISKTLTYPTNTDLNIYVTMSGAPVGNLLGASSSTTFNSHTEVFTPILPCVDECDDSCPSNVDCNVVANAFIKQFNERKTIGGELLSKYIKVSKLVSCTTPSGYVTTSCVKWGLTVFDGGMQVDLGKVQAQYPASTVTRVSRTGFYSAYELVLCNGTTPTAYNTSVTPVVPNCTTCPSGYTYVNSLYSFNVTRSDAGNSAALVAFKANYASTTEETTAIRQGYAFGTSTYQVYAATSTLAAAVAGDVVTFIGEVQDLCTQNVATSSAWVSGDACTKASLDYQISLKNDLCGDGFLTELQATYTSIGTVTQGITNSANCTTIYYLHILSDNVACDTCNVRDYSFTEPSPFNGSVWTLQDVSHDGVGCVCGVKFESAYVQRDRAECYFEEVSYEVEPLFINISTINPDNRDYSSLCAERIPVTVVQGIKYAVGYGSSILSDRVVQSNFYFNRPWSNDPATRAAMGYELGINLQGYYDTVVLGFYADVDEAGNSMGSTSKELYTQEVYFPEGQATSFINAINAFLTYPGVSVPPLSL